RGCLRVDGGRRYARSDRHGDEAGPESSDGAARAGRLHRPRRVPRHPERAARGARRSEVPSLSAPAPAGCCRAPRSQVRPRVLYVLVVRRASWGKSPPRRTLRTLRLKPDLKRDFSSVSLVSSVVASSCPSLPILSLRTQNAWRDVSATPRPAPAPG